MRALYQAQLDNGSWETATLLLPERDPASRAESGGTEHQLETIYNYKDSLRKLCKGQGGKDGEADHGKGQDGKGAGKGGRRKDKDGAAGQ